MKNYWVLVALLALTACDGDGSATIVDSSANQSPANASASANANVNASSNTETTSTSEDPDYNFEPQLGAAQAAPEELIGTWVFCEDRNNSDIASELFSITFGDDGNTNIGFEEYAQPNCTGEATGQIIDSFEYSVLGTTTTTEGLSAFALLESELETYYYIDGGTLYIAENIPDIGIVIDFTTPYAKQ